MDFTNFKRTKEKEILKLWVGANHKQGPQAKKNNKKQHNCHCFLCNNCKRSPWLIVTLDHEKKYCAKKLQSISVKIRRSLLKGSLEIACHKFSLIACLLLCYSKRAKDISMIGNDQNLFEERRKSKEIETLWELLSMLIFWSAQLSSRKRSQLISASNSEDDDFRRRFARWARNTWQKTNVNKQNKIVFNSKQERTVIYQTDLIWTIWTK